MFLGSFVKVELAFVGARAALDADVKEDLERFVFAEELTHLLHGLLFPVRDEFGRVAKGDHVLFLGRM